MTKSLQGQSHTALSEDSGDRFVDLAIDLREWDGFSRILEVGGRWDRIEREWVGDATQVVQWRVQPAQYEAAYAFADWFRAYVEGRRPVGAEDTYVHFTTGGRGGGKSNLGVRESVMVAVGMRDRIVWCVSPTEEETLELQRVVEATTPRSFYRWLKSDLAYTFWNGSSITLKSGYKPGNLKQGRVDFWLLNEAQRFAKAAYVMIRPRLADTSGLGFVAANPPRDEKGQWVLEFHDLARAGKLPGIRHFHFDQKKNPIIDQRSLELLRSEFGEEDYAREIEGAMIPTGKTVFYAWSDLPDVGNVRPLPEVHKLVTAEFTKRHFQRAFDRVVALDFQLAPHMAGAVGELVANPENPTEPLLWYTDELVVKGTEDDLCDEMEDRFDPESTVLICDASGWWQDAERKKGRASVDLLRARGWKFVFRPDRKLKKNPLVVDRVLAANARFCAAGVRRAFSLPENIQLNRALKLWEYRKGVPNKRSDFAHLGDAASYLVWRFWPHRARRKPFEFQSGGRERSERERELDGVV